MGIQSLFHKQQHGRDGPLPCRPTLVPQSPAASQVRIRHKARTTERHKTQNKTNNWKKGWPGSIAIYSKRGMRCQMHGAPALPCTSLRMFVCDDVSDLQCCDVSSCSCNSVLCGLLPYLQNCNFQLSRAKYSCKKRSCELAFADPFAMLSRPHVLLSRALFPLELLSRCFRVGLSHSMQAFAGLSRRDLL